MKRRTPSDVRRAQRRREAMLERFGKLADERRPEPGDRRQPGTPDQLEARMRAAGVTADRRRGERRQR